MWDLIFSAMLAVLNIQGQSQATLEPLEYFPWGESQLFELPPSQPDPIAENKVRDYLQKFNQGDRDSQGVWLQSDWNVLADNLGKTPLPAASLTKIATTLVALEEWGVKHQFTTKVYSQGAIVAGVLQGDLIVEGSGDPLFVWEEAIALANAVENLGIKSIQGNLLVNDRFYMNYQRDSIKAGSLLKQSFDRQLWQGEITKQFLQMPSGTNQPEIAIAGEVRAIDTIPSTATLLIDRKSLPLSEILRQMNIYSNNQMSEILANLLGGAKQIAARSAKIADFPSDEIELINGSGLGEANRISPRAVCQMLIAVDRLLAIDSLTAADLFPTAGKDLVGTVKSRGLPPGTSVKTGTLDRVSALAGVIPTQDKGNVYFSIINYGNRYQYFRQQQDWLLNELAKDWQLGDRNFDLARQPQWFLGNPQRNQISQ